MKIEYTECDDEKEFEGEEEKQKERKMCQAFSTFSFIFLDFLFWPTPNTQHATHKQSLRFTYLRYTERCRWKIAKRKWSAIDKVRYI